MSSHYLLLMPELSIRYCFLLFWARRPVTPVAFLHETVVLRRLNAQRLFRCPLKSYPPAVFMPESQVKARFDSLMSLGFCTRLPIARLSADIAEAVWDKSGISEWRNSCNQIGRSAS